MQSASQLPFPSGRALASWWQQLQPLRPAALWVGYVHIHRVEAAVRVMQPRRAEPLVRLLLHALTLAPAVSACCGAREGLHRLENRLHLPEAVLRQLLSTLEAEGLIERQPPAGWTLTERGRGVLGGQDYAVESRQRRVFTFAERLDAEGRRALPPHYLPLAECPAAPWRVEDGERFAPNLLAEAAGRPAAWKHSMTFPAEVLAVETGTDEGDLAPWRQVVVDRAEQVFLALVQVNAEVLGFAARPGDWTLADAAPALRLALAATVALWPELQHPADMGLLREAWLGWCRQRGVAAGDAEACELSSRPGRVDVRAPERLLHRLRSLRSDVFKGETWLLPGTGYLRPAVAVHLHVPSRADAGFH